MYLYVTARVFIRLDYAIVYSRDAISVASTMNCVSYSDMYAGLKVRVCIYE
jgi:hypothetical protein